MDLTEIWSDTMTKPIYIWAWGEVELLLLDLNGTLFKKIYIKHIYFPGMFDLWWRLAIPHFNNKPDRPKWPHLEFGTYILP